MLVLRPQNMKALLWKEEKRISFPETLLLLHHTALCVQPGFLNFQILFCFGWCALPSGTRVSISICKRSQAGSPLQQSLPLLSLHLYGQSNC